MIKIIKNNKKLLSTLILSSLLNINVSSFKGDGLEGGGLVGGNKIVKIVANEVESYCNDNSCYSSYIDAVSNIEEYKKIIDFAADVFGIDFCTIAAVILVESKGNPYALSPKWAAGVMQLMKSTARRHGLNINYYEDWRFSPFSIIAGAEEIRDLIEKYKRLEDALVAYVAGEDKIGKLNKVETIRNYINNILKTIHSCKKIEERITDKDIFSEAKIYYASSNNDLYNLRKVCNNRLINRLNPQITRGYLKKGQIVLLPKNCQFGEKATLEEKVEAIYKRKFERLKKQGFEISKIASSLDEIKTTLEKINKKKEQTLEKRERKKEVKQEKVEIKEIETKIENKTDETFKIKYGNITIEIKGVRPEDIKINYH